MRVPSSDNLLAGMLQDALRFHRSGQLDAAEVLYQRILGRQRSHVDTLHLLGICRHQRGDFAGAVKHLRTALKLRPEHAALHVSYGNALREMNQLPEATRSYERASRIAPSLEIAHYNLGTALESAERHVEAIAAFERAHALRPNADAIGGRANCLVALGRMDEARLAYREAIRLEPSYVNGLANLGAILLQGAEFEEAFALLERALALQPAHEGAKRNRQLLLNELQRPIGSAQQTSLSPAAGVAQEVAVLRQRARALVALRRLDEAILALERALALQPTHRGVRLELAGALTWHGERNTEALTLLELLLAQEPNDMHARLHRGTIFFSVGDYGQAREEFAHVEATEQPIGKGGFNVGLLDLLEGNFESGLRRYEGRWDDPVNRVHRRPFAQAVWLGDDDIGGATLLVHSEQGFGDTLHFCRYLPLLRQRAAKVIFQVPGSLFSLLRRCLPQDIAVVPDGRALPPFDRHLPLASAPLAVRSTLDNLPWPGPYLAADRHRVQVWRNRLRDSAKLRIGLAWSGNPGHAKDRQRSLAPHLLRALIERVSTDGARGIELIALQNLLRPEDREVWADFPALQYFGDAVGDFDDTAALAELCDVVLSVDTAAAHLAGAMGRPVWLLAPFVPDWRWLLGRADSPWYPSMRLFRQRQLGEWTPVLEDVESALRQLQAGAGAQ